MAITINGYEVLRRVGSSPTTFPALESDLSKSAETLVKKQLKDKRLELSSLRAISQILGDETFALILDLTSPKELSALLKKFDKHWTTAEANIAGASRRRIMDLAFKRVEPADKPAITVKKNTPKISKSASPFGTSAMGTRRG